MKKSLFLLAAVLLLACAAQAQSTIRVFNRILFYDGYAARVDSPPPPHGIIRHRNDLYARKLTEAELSTVGSHMRIQVVIKAACDNYDRIGNVNLALVPKGDTAYHPDSVKRLELARFITPFMNKNLRPDTVPYVFRADNVTQILRDSALRANYDFWAELQVFGVPYAAQTQVAGCAGRIDVQYGTLDLISEDGPGLIETDNVLFPVQFMKNLNNYDAAATDTVGKTTRTLVIDVPRPLRDAALFLITSNHGSNDNGEEYNRRMHYVYWDDTLRMSYKPGRLTCEPFRRYNTQGNGIYGTRPRTAGAWQSFSNWCPGDVIDIRILHLGAVDSGSHKFLIRVPDAIFNQAQGYFPISLYMQGKEGWSTDSVATKLKPSIERWFTVYPNPAARVLKLEAPLEAGAASATLINTLGESVYHASLGPGGENTLEIGVLPSGLYVLQIQTRFGIETHRIQIESGR